MFGIINDLDFWYFQIQTYISIYLNINFDIYFSYIHGKEKEREPNLNMKVMYVPRVPYIQSVDNFT